MDFLGLSIEKEKKIYAIRYWRAASLCKNECMKENESWHGLKLTEEQSAEMQVYIEAMRKELEAFFLDIHPYIPQEWKEEKNCE